MSKEDSTEFPGWPDTYVAPSAAVQRTGNIAERAHDLTKTGPDPADVIKFKKDNNATITETASRFCLSRMQVIKVCGAG